MGFGKDGKGAIIQESQVVALAALTSLESIAFGNALAITDDFRILKSEISCLIEGLTAGEGLGLMLYLFDGDLSTSELNSSLTLDGPLNANDSVAAAIAERWAKHVATFGGGASTTQGLLLGPEGGDPITITPRWTFGASSWKWAIWNNSGANLTTGATARLRAKHYGVWIR